jgi:hypothetical protein
MSSLQSLMRCASAVRRKRQRSSRPRPIFLGRFGLSIDRDAEPSGETKRLWARGRIFFVPVSLSTKVA